MLNAVKYGNLALSFLLEILMLAAFAYWGFYAGSGTLLKIILAMGLPLVAATIWGVFLAPRSAKRLTGFPQLVLETIIFALAAIALAATAHPELGLALALVFVINRVLVAVLGETT